MAEARWKRREREIAARLGGERVPITGRGRGSAPDVEHDIFAIEVKARKNTPQLLRDAMDQAKASARLAKQKGKIPLVVLCEHGRPLDKAHVVMRFEDFVRMQELARDFTDGTKEALP